MGADASGAAAAPQLLRTKLHAPRRRSGTIDRPRLSAGATDRERPRLTLVSAPAGFGKSTLLAEWFGGAGDGPCAAWLSLDARDDEPTTFWTYVIAAVQSVAPEAATAAAEVLASTGSVDAALAALVGDLETLDDPISIVLDDYHVIGSPEIHEGVAFLLDHLPAGVGLVLATRVDPPLPLARLRASGDLVERRAADLRFTGDEAARYFDETMGLALATEDVDALETRTEGWIAALQLAALSMQGREDVAGFIESFTGDDRFVVDYLVEEVLDRQPPEVRRFLLETSVLTRLTGPLCDAVTGGAAGRATLDRLDRSNLFLVPLDDRRQWYRYHHLFADVLRARLLDEAPETVPELHRRAAAWWAGDGDVAEAVTHALAGGDLGLAAELVERAAPDLQRTRQERLLRSWLEALPEDMFADRPVLAIVLVGARMATGDIAGVEPLLAGVEQWLDAETAPPGDGPIVADHEQFARLPSQVAVQRAGLALMSGDLERVTFHAEQVLASAAPDDDVRRGAATALLGLAAWARGDLDNARARYSTAIDHFVRGTFYADALGCSQGLADMCLAQGRFADAERAFTFGLDLVSAHPGLRGAADMHRGLGEVLLERHELAAARAQLEASEALGERAGLPQHPYRWRVARARLLQAEGDLDGAVRLLAEAERLYDTDYSPSVRPVAAIVARVKLAQGDVDAAMRWAEARGLTAHDELDYVREYEHLTLARTLVAQQTLDRVDRGAMGLLDRLAAAAEAGGRRGVVAECLVYTSLAHVSAGARPAALDALARALTLAAEDDAVRIFLDGGPAIAALLRSGSFDGPAARHARRVLDATAGVEPAPALRSGLVDELSARELDVLRLLRSDLSGPEIARELIVSLNTMRTHTKSIYAKLGVGTRREAVRRAAELGL
ncbi:MAG: LuxR C-terminal-related transcriptional regulator [Acidimicrobiales bacterium]